MKNIFLKKSATIVLIILLLVGVFNSQTIADTLNGWENRNGSWYYYENGKVQTGWERVNGKWYYMNSAGKMQTGWINYNGKKYFLNSNGAMVTGWKKIKNKWYYFSASGSMKTGWLKNNNKKYYLNSKGIMQTGWVKYKDKWYYFNKSGAMKTGWLKLNNKKYYLLSSGIRKSGWMKYDGARYYFDSKGVMLTGKQKISGKIEVFGTDGKWLRQEITVVSDKTGDNNKTKAKRGTQATTLKNLQAEAVVRKMAPKFTADQKKSGILASVSMAQFILESGYGKSTLAQKANNLFGMKCPLSGNTWAGSKWDGVSKYVIKTDEQNKDGSYVTISAAFRKYECIEDSIADHSAYLLGAMNGSELRYKGLKGCTDYKKATKIIAKGGYATGLSYAKSLNNVIEYWNLTQYDLKK